MLTPIEEQIIPQDVELRTKIDVAERMVKFSKTTIESKKRMMELIAGYKKQLAKIEKKATKKDG